MNLEYENNPIQILVVRQNYEAFVDGMEVYAAAYHRLRHSIPMYINTGDILWSEVVILNYGNNMSLFKNYKWRKWYYIGDEEARGGRVPGNRVLTHGRWEGPAPPLTPMDPP